MKALVVTLFLVNVFGLILPFTADAAVHPRWARQGEPWSCSGEEMHLMQYAAADLT